MDYYGEVRLLSVVSKCYTSVLRARLHLWLGENTAITECHVGIYHSAVDQIFNLYAIVQNCFKKKAQKLYVSFVDFRKAFNSVRHDKHLDSVKYQRIRGKLSGALMAHSVLAYEPTASTLSFSSVLLGFVKGMC